MNETPGATPSSREPQAAPELSVVIPVFNEAENIAPLLERLRPVLERSVASYEIIFVDDGGRDETLARLREAHAHDPRVIAISFSRNFGKEIAIAAGLDHAGGRAVVIMDADLQHPPEMIATFVAKWREGYQNVYGVRASREGEGYVRRKAAEQFYALFDMFGETKLPAGAGDFRLLDRKAVDALRQMGERARFSKGLYAWIGFKSIGAPFEVAPRAHGVSKFSYRKLTRFAFDGLMSFSTLPLKIWIYVGTIVSMFALVMAIFFLLQTITHGVDVPGYASLIVSILFLSGVQLMSLGILGEYVGRIFAEVKGRPLYIVGERIGIEHEYPRPPAIGDARGAM